MGGFSGQSAHEKLNNVALNFTIAFDKGELMEVLIDGVRYAPVPDVAEGQGLLAALEMRLEQSDAGDNITVRDYLRLLLETVWEEKEGFSGKRPFGNSGWEYELYAPLIQCGAIQGTLDEEGCVLSVNREQGQAYVKQLILAVFNGVGR